MGLPLKFSRETKIHAMSLLGLSTVQEGEDAIFCGKDDDRSLMLFEGYCDNTKIFGIFPRKLCFEQQLHITYSPNFSRNNQWMREELQHPSCSPDFFTSSLKLKKQLRRRGFSSQNELENAYFTELTKEFFFRRLNIIKETMEEVC